MTFFNKKQLGPIGFDLAMENLHLLQLEGKESRFTVRAGASLPYPGSRDELLADKAGFKSFVSKALKKSPFKGREIVSCLPPTKVRIFPVNYEKRLADRAEEQAIVKAVIQKTGGTASDYVIDYVPIRGKEKDAQDKTALAVVANRKEVLDYLELLTGCGLEISALDVGPAVLRRLVSSADTDKHYPSVLMINFGHQQSYLTFLSGRRLMLDRVITFGESRFLETLAASLDVSQSQAKNLLYQHGFGRRVTNGESGADEVAETIGEILKPLLLDFSDEVNKLLVYAASESRGESVQTAYIFGSAARYPGIIRVMEDLLAIDCRILNPIGHFDHAAHIRESDFDPVVSMAVVTGLALRGLFDG